MLKVRWCIKERGPPILRVRGTLEVVSTEILLVLFSSESQSLKTRRNNRTNTWKNFTESVTNLKNKLLHWEKSWIIHQRSIWNSLEGKYHILVLVVEESDCCYWCCPYTELHLNHLNYFVIIL